MATEAASSTIVVDDVVQRRGRHAHPLPSLPCGQLTKRTGVTCHAMRETRNHLSMESTASSNTTPSVAARTTTEEEASTRRVTNRTICSLQRRLRLLHRADAECSSCSHYSKRRNFRRLKPSDIRFRPSDIAYLRRF
jgi:hypothetical protein